MIYQGEEWRFIIDGQEWRGRQWGDSNGFPILALPGWLDNAASFDGLAPLLSKDFYILALDLLGQGLSSHLSAAESYEMRFEVIGLEKVIRALEWSHYALLAHSRGGGLAVLLAAMTAPMLAGMVLLDSLGPLSAQMYEASAALKDFHLKMTARSRNNQHTIYPSLAEAHASRLKVNDLSPKALEALVSRGLKKVEGGYSWRFDLRLLQPSEHLLDEEVILKCIANIQCPVLLIRAKQGLLIQHPLLTQRKLHFKHFKEINVDGGHYAHLNTPENIAVDVDQFFLKVQNLCAK